MAIPIRQGIRIGAYLAKQKITRNKKFPLIVELEPLFACNLACNGCGKIQHPANILKQRMPVEQAVGAITESGAPMVSIAGGEPLMHPQIDEIVRQLVAKKKFVYLCTNGLLLKRHLHKFKPSPYFAWVVHIDGMKEAHDLSVSKEGGFEGADAAVDVPHGVAGDNSLPDPARCVTPDGIRTYRIAAATTPRRLRTSRSNLDVGMADVKNPEGLWLGAGPRTLRPPAPPCMLRPPARA